MNLIGLDIGNSTINIGLFVEGKEEPIQTVKADDKAQLAKILSACWGKIPFVNNAKDDKRDGVIIASTVNPNALKMAADTVEEKLSEKLLVMGTDIGYPIDISVDDKDKVGSDRVTAASAAYAVVEEAVVIVDVGTAVTIDLVDARGVFCGGSIIPGFQLSAKALYSGTAQLPEIKIVKPALPFGKNTEDAINCGLYYAMVGAIEEIIRRYAEKIGSWPKTILTGSGAAVIKDDCQFIDSYVPNLVIKGIALAYTKHIESRF
jgi:type III pantothenate kinase